MVRESHPDHGFIGEEFGHDAGAGEFAWIVDPIDGTKQFITGVPLFGTLIGLLQNGRPILGVADIPAMHERWIGVQGRQTLLDGNVCQTSRITQIAEATIYTTSPDIFAPEQWTVFDSLSQRCRFRRYGLDCYAYTLLSAGHADIVMEAGLHPFDILPLVPIIEGAGGRLTDWEGYALTLDHCERALAVANDALHVATVDSIRDSVARTASFNTIE